MRSINRYIKAIYRRLVFKKHCRSNHIKIAKGSFVSPDIQIGRYTRINNRSHLENCEIGSFCAMGGRLIIRSTDHYTNHLNMQDYFQHSVLKSEVRVAGKSKGKVKVGNGVWIGDSVIILSGVHIGNGAVIGAGSVVTKSVPKFAIAVGNPAKVIKFRFNQSICDSLDELKWWEWSIARLKRNKFLFETDFENTTQEDLTKLLGKIVE